MRYRELERPQVVGMISGTSADAIDAVLVEIERDTRKLNVIRSASMPFPPKIRERVFALMEDRATVRELARMHYQLGELFAEAALEVMHGSPADLIASHGQTVAHLPRANEDGPAATLQIGEAAVIASRTNTLTVADFRAADLVEGGQAAPLVPIFDHWFLHSQEVDRVTLNLGGFANITWLPKNGDVLGWDTGPANVLMDALAEVFLQAPCDRNGELAHAGQVISDLLVELLEHPYFAMPHPKSTGREEFGREMAQRIKDRGRPADVMRTALVLTAESLAREIRRLTTDPIELIAAGGGTKNPVLMQEIEARLRPARMLNFDHFGVDVQLKEAVAFAVLGHLCAGGEAAGLPSVTGAGRPAVLGKISFPPPIVQ